MAARKLQAEIERTLKKVSEGVEIFESIFEKISTASNQAQKEKFEGDLKKEIKKLQRYRDQIKSWASSNEIKDKRALLDNRKLIEQQMEKFKAMEKELKTKAYSQAGLNAASRIDPQEKEKEDLRQWIAEMTDELNVQIDMLEAELETLQIAVRKAKKGDSSKSDRVSKIDKIIERHKHHQTTLEIVLRMMDNGNLKLEEVASVQDDVAYYVESNQDPDFEEDEGIYEGLNLEEAEAYGFANEDEDEDDSDTDTPMVSPPLKEREITVKNHAKDRDADSEIKRKGSKNDHDVKVSSPSKLKATVLPVRATVKEDLAKGSMLKSIILPPRPAPTPVRSVTGTALVEAPAPLSQRYAAAAASTTIPDPHIKPFKAADTGKGIRQLTADVMVPAAANLTVAGSHQTSSLAVLATNVPTHTEEINGKQHSIHTALPNENHPLAVQTLAQKGSPQSLTTVSPSRVTFNLANSQYTSTSTSMPPSLSPSSNRSLVATPLASETFSNDMLHRIALDQSAESSPPIMEAMDNHLPPILADLVASFDIAKERSQRTSNDAYFSRMVESSFQCLIDATDSAKSKAYTAKDPYPVPSYYPQTPLATFESNPLIFERFDVDTLFFIFYYRIGTYQQFLAARELKRQSWRFHKKYLTWFQRHEEPKTITDEFEQGTYVYFDYEESWCQRKKTDFRFEYKYLEDEVQLQ
ncbi:general negative regulator of transcription subunit 5 [Batrachochytrium dendrobatidis]|nr:general negative regulator of transcription subunit 5 [Batrachochytrium dendrobatidis]KAK5667903.1 general negative regulator of transcription subunit 5 [Batrachochytrium dendrobatidis]